MSRLPPLPETKQDPEQTDAHKLLVTATSARYGDSIPLRREDGAFLGPFPTLLYTPTLVQPYISYATSLMPLLSPTNHPVLTAHSLELAVLGSLSQCYSHDDGNIDAYPFQAHILLAQKTGLSPQQAKDASIGYLPHGLCKVDEAIFEFSKEVAWQKKPIRDEVWGALRSALISEIKEGDKEKEADQIMAGVLQISGWYVYQALVMNAVDMKFPTS